MTDTETITLRSMLSEDPIRTIEIEVDDHDIVKRLRGLIASRYFPLAEYRLLTKAVASIEDSHVLAYEDSRHIQDLSELLVDAEARVDQVNAECDSLAALLYETARQNGVYQRRLAERSVQPKHAPQTHFSNYVRRGLGEVRRALLRLAGW